MSIWTRPASDRRPSRACSALLVALTLLASLVAPLAEATPARDPAAAAQPLRVDVRNPGAAGLTLRHPYSAQPYTVVEVSPGIGVTNRLSPTSGTLFASDGTLLSDDRFQLLVNRVSDVIDLIRTTPTGNAALKAIPNLLGPSAKGVWTVPRPNGAQGRTSAVQIVFAEGADTAAGANGEQAVAEGPAGSGSMIVLGRGTWSDTDAGDYAWFDPETGAARIVRPVESVQHELMHAIADLGGGTPAMRSVDVPTAAWREWPVAGAADATAIVEVALAELFTQGGPLGLTAAREALTSPGPSGAAPEFTTEEFPSIAVDPWMLRANRYATDRFLAADTPSFEREGWLRAAAARLSIAIRPPTEATFSRERGVPGRPEYQPSTVHVDGGNHTLIPLSITGGSTPWEAPDLRQWPGVAPAHGTWETPHLTAPTVPSENTPGGSAAPGGSADSDDGLPRVHCAACSATGGRLLSAEDAAAFKARVAAEVGSAFEGPRAVQRRVLADPVGDAIR
ncbi:hypothetical protein, partial [Rathayibacter sp. PhB152]|uniref:hypothetical protein n=1 Tax=Rathayibacter sp. PhB152 TaxID=2485190 RepID=UPI001616972F